MGLAWPGLNNRLLLPTPGPIIHLDEMNSLDLLRGFGRILIPSEVWIEVNKHRAHLTISHIPDATIVSSPNVLSPQLLAMVHSLSLDAGETEALSFMESEDVEVFLTDDAAARLAAEALGHRVHGTIGLIARAVRKGYRTRDDVIQLLRSLPQCSTLHISRYLLLDVIAAIESNS